MATKSILGDSENWLCDWISPLAFETINVLRPNKPKNNRFHKKNKKKTKKNLPAARFEPGSRGWEPETLPLGYRRDRGEASKVSSTPPRKLLAYNTIY